jgi:predicted permease
MKFARAFWSRLRSLGRGRSVKREIDEELRFHIEQRIAENIAAGMPPEEAARDARKRFGSFQKLREECRGVRGAPWGETTLKDISFGLRMLRKNPGFTSVVVLSLGLGIGVNVAVFSCLSALVFRPLPGIRNPDTLVYQHSWMGGVPYQEFEYLRDHNQVFSALAASAPCRSLVRMESVPTGLRPDSSAVQRHEGYPSVRLVSGNYFSVLEREAALGRTFLQEEDQTPGSHPVAVMSHRFWELAFNSDPQVVGKTILLNRIAYTVVGIAPEDFPREPGEFISPNLWVPFMMQGELDPGQNGLHPNDGNEHGGVQFYGRLRPGATLDHAKAELGILDRQFGKEYFDPREQEHAFSWAPYLQSGFAFLPWRREIALIFTLIMFIVGMVLLIACANLANLLLSRATTRQREMCVRLALGASRFRLVRQLLTENLLIALLGGATGLLLGAWAANIIGPRFVMAVMPSGWATVFDFNLDWRTFGYALALSLVTGVVFGLAPALESTKASLSAGLKQDNAVWGERISRSRVRNFLVVGQVAVSLAFLICTSLILRRVQTGMNQKFNFEIAHVLMLDVSSPSTRPREFQRELADRFRAVPGVKSAALGRVWYAPHRDYKSIRVDGQIPQRTEGITESMVAPEYFSTLEIPIVRGRNFSEEDAKNGSPVVIVSESFASQFWPKQDPLGHHLRLGLTNVEAEVVGVAKDGIRVIRSQYELDAFSGDLYSPLPTDNTNTCELWVRTEGDMATIAPVLRREATLLDKDVRFNIRPLKGMAEQWTGPTMLVAGAVGTLGILALLLATVGVYGVMAYAVTQRIHEVGIRMALGAQRGAILRLVVWDGMRLVFAGMLVGLAGSAALSFVLRHVLYGLSPLDPISFIGVSSFLTLAALLACYVPARRATKVDPMIALRYE